MMCQHKKLHHGWPNNILRTSTATKFMGGWVKCPAMTDFMTAPEVRHRMKSVTQSL